MTTTPSTPAPDRDAAATQDAHPAPQGPVEPEAAPAARANCRADAAGTLTFVLPNPAAGPVPAHLVLCRRRTDPAEEVLLPLDPGPEGHLVARLAASADFAEGRWDAFLQDPDGTRRRLTPGVNDLRALVDRVPDAADGRICVRIPYGTKQNELAVRSWVRAPHVEVGELRIAGDTLTVRGRVHGTRLTEQACVELRGRTAPRPLVRFPVDVDGDDFTGSVGYPALLDAARQEFWDLWLRPAGEDNPRVRIARLLDDIADKKPIFSFPAVRIPARPATPAPVTVRPYYTVDNDLAIRVEAVPPEESEGPA